MKKKQKYAKNKIIFIILLIIIVYSLLFYFEFYVQRGIPFIQEQSIWSISMYEGNPLALKPINYFSHPILSAKDITDVNAQAVADPFIFKKDETYYMFFEVVDKETRLGEIGVATSNDALSWTYQQSVLKEPFHLSYPYVFEYGGNYYLIPQSSKTDSVRLYKSEDFPYEWKYVKDILTDNNYTDSSIVCHNDVWYMFTTTNKSSTMRLFFSDSLEGEWTEHPMSPIYTNNKKYSRGAGRIITYKSSLIRYAQDGEFEYGKTVYALNITMLNKTFFKENLLNVSVLDTSNYGWNRDGMHQVDVMQISEDKWIASVDGKRNKIMFGRDY